MAKLLGFSISQLKNLSKDDNYRPWTKIGKNGKSRIIEEPLPDLARLQQRAYKLLRKVETPIWLMSGKRGIKPQDNAIAHADGAYIINVDIQSFFQSTKREFVYRCFQKDFEIRDDVASVMADLLTYESHIPTGTATSQLMAFWAYRRTFERIHSLCKSQGIAMTLWVDDITFSREKPFPRGWVRTLSRIFRSVDLNLKSTKTKRYGPRQFKIVTGSAITPAGELRVRNAKRREILLMLGSRRVEDLSLGETRSVLGRITSQRQNEPEFFDDMFRRCRDRVKKLSG
ncbi:MAG: reverse transcriptase family protein [Alphaproteobacteria bacterium]|nr:reverse transcriptase family protein [Alphaproteobacteria bacterium]